MTVPQWGLPSMCCCGLSSACEVLAVRLTSPSSWLQPWWQSSLKSRYFVKVIGPQFVSPISDITWRLQSFFPEVLADDISLCLKLAQLLFAVSFLHQRIVCQRLVKHGNCACVIRHPRPALASALFCYTHLDGLLSPQMIDVYLGVSGGPGDHFPPVWRLGVH